VRIRPEKVAHLMRREIAEIVLMQLRDPRMSTMMSVTDVEVTSDLSFARVYVSMLGDDSQRALSLKALQHAAGFIRRELGDRLGLREVPELRFMLDASLDRGARVDELLRRIDRGELPPDEEEGGA